MQRDYIDACVFLAVVFDEPQVYECQQYLNLVGYKQRPRGVISHFVVGELFVNCIIKKTKNRDGIIKNLAELITSMFEENKLIVTKYRKIEPIAADIQKQDYCISDDDACTIALAIISKCSRFITIDKMLLASCAKSWLRKKHGLKITLPV